MSQLELFCLPDPCLKDGLECNNCGIVQPKDNFQHIKTGEIKRMCKSCSSNHYHLLKRLKNIHPYPNEDYTCPICERDIEEIASKGQKKLQSWVLDHCHGTELFRGWLCGNCNTGLGAFKDKINRVKRATEYLEKHEEKKDD